MGNSLGKSSQAHAEKVDQSLVFFFFFFVAVLIVSLT